jgi:pentose-5-phosphate-3-epimerase/membrane protein CcdC involved in cytochrome C biogenesis
MLNDPTMAEPPIISPPTLKLATPDPDQIYSTTGPATSSVTFGDRGVLEIVGPRARLFESWRAFRRRGLAHYVYRHRYLAGFTAIGLMSILVELAALQTLPAWWPRSTQVVVAFLVGMLLSLVLNMTVNFHVPRQYLVRTTAWFVTISICSFALNMAIVDFVHTTTDMTYGWLRLGMSGILFTLAYTLHRTFTFNQSRNFGIAVYATESEDVPRIFRAVGHFCDHVHVDLVDNTVLPNAAPVCLERIDEVRKHWRGYPVCLHVMSRRPREWAEQTWHQVDWYLFSCDVFDDLMELIFACRERGKKVGVVWHEKIPTGRLLEFLPHVDFVMVLGISQPGRSGQTLNEHGIAVAQTLEAMRPMYHYDLMFDGGVKTTNAARIPGRYLVSASGVLTAEKPTHSAEYLRKSRYRPVAFRCGA